MYFVYTDWVGNWIESIFVFDILYKRLRRWIYDKNSYITDFGTLLIKCMRMHLEIRTNKKILKKYTSS